MAVGGEPLFVAGDAVADDAVRDAVHFVADDSRPPKPEETEAALGQLN